jgi:hypothetical protein
MRCRSCAVTPLLYVTEIMLAEAGSAERAPRTVDEFREFSKKSPSTTRQENRFNLRQASRWDRQRTLVLPRRSICIWVTSVG